MGASRRRKPPGATTRGGWGHSHQRRRAAIAPLVRAGKATCARCGEPIHPDEDWHLDHNATLNGYLGPSHARCNLSAGAAVVNGRRATAPNGEMPYRGSQRWSEDPPIGTIKYDGGRNPEIYVGNGDWQPLNGTAHGGDGEIHSSEGHADADGRVSS